MKNLVVVGISLMLFLGCNKKNQTPTGSDTPTDSVQKYQELVAKAPSYENYITLGMELAKAGRGLEAIGAYNKAIEINPKAPIAWNNLCAEQNSQQKYLDASSSCEKALALEPKFVLAQNNLAFTKAKIAELKKVVWEKKKTVLGNPKTQAQDLINLGMDLFNVSELKSSIEIWSKIGPSDPLYATAQNNIATSYTLLKNFGQAETAIAEALRLDPKNVLFSNNKKWLDQQKSAKN